MARTDVLQPTKMHVQPAAVLADAVELPPMPTKSDEPQFTLVDLTLLPTYVAIDNVVYDLAALSTKHPGGTDCMMLGGIDASLHYHTLHPFHTRKNTLWMQQFRVGRLVSKKLSYEVTDQLAAVDSSSEVLNCWDDSTTKYTLNSDFAQELKSEVLQYFKQNNLRMDATFGYWCRALLFTVLYVTAEYHWITSPSPLHAAFTVVFTILIGLNIPHEANHGTLNHTYPIVNDICSWTMDMLGQSRYLWIQVHNFSHHLFVNEAACDHDTTSGEPFISFDVEENIKYAQGRWWWQAASQYRYGKHVMSFFFLQFYRTLMMLDFSAITYMYKYDDNQNAATYDRARRIPRPTPWLLHPLRRHLSVVLHALHVTWSYLPVVLMVYHNCTVNTILYALLSLYIRDAGISLGLSLNFLISHNFEGAQRTVYDSATSKGPVDWYQMQAEGSCSYGSTLGIWLTGGLSHQIEHHLFQKINSAHFPQISPIVRRVCIKHGIKYQHYDSVGSNLMSMIRYLASIH